MGLDMYLTTKKYTSRWDYSQGYDNRSEFPDFVKATEGLNDAAKYLYKDAVGMEHSFTTMYWRKANAIHNWFVENVQEGEDNCAEYYVSTGQLTELRDACATVIKHDFNPSIAEEFLPPTAGFFFGSTEIDDWYRDDIRMTLERLNEILDMVAEDAKNEIHHSFFYQSSW